VQRESAGNGRKAVADKLGVRGGSFGVFGKAMYFFQAAAAGGRRRAWSGREFRGVLHGRNENARRAVIMCCSFWAIILMHGIDGKIRTIAQNINERQRLALLEG